MAELEVSNLHLWRGERHVLRRISFSISPGEALQLLWPNGAGKTSLLRTLAGFLHPDEGQILWQGTPVNRCRDEFHRALAWLGHDTGLKADLTAVENLRFLLGLRRRIDDAGARAALAASGLDPRHFDQPVGRLSAGQQRRVALARLAGWDARLWLLDEPASNLDAAGQAFVARTLDAHLAAGGMAIVATHQPVALAGRSRAWSAPAVAP